MDGEGAGPRRKGGRNREQAGSAPRRDYRRLRNPFVPQAVFSVDEIARIHETALRILEVLGIKVLEPEARGIFARAGALVDESTMMARLRRDVVDAALASAPKSIRLRAGDPGREQDFEAGALLFMAGSGCPNAFDRERGRRPGNLLAFEETLKLQQSFDVIHMLGPSAEPQDIPPHLRHYAMMRAQLALSDKPLFVYSRGTKQVAGNFEMIRLAHGIGDAEFAGNVWAYTVINTNSPRLLDIPMARGIIDFARAGQLAIVTPFCLAGAMAPVTIAGALTLQHAEALFGITLSQLARPGAPVAYGGFASNVDMKSGSPAFGTPEHIRANLGSGQLARHIGLPWRAAAGSTSKLADAQGATETGMSVWGAVLAGATVTIHTAGWLEGGLTFGYEKFINDIEILQTIADLATPERADDDAIGYPAIAEVAPGGHFFSTAHTFARYRSAFYEPLVADLSNHGAWTEAGALSADERATGIWKRVLAGYTPPRAGATRAERIAGFIDRRTAEGGAPPQD